MSIQTGDRMDDNKACGDQYPLAEMSGLGPAALVQLKARWITTAEQLLSVAAAPNGVSGIAELLDIAKEEVEGLLDEVRKTIGTVAARSIQTAAQPGGSLGVVLTDEQRRDLGMSTSVEGDTDR